MTSSPAIVTRAVRKTYGKTTAVDSVDLEVATGEIFAVLGPNGAGKTTTIEICEGYRQRDGGEVTVLGVDPANADQAWRSRVGIVLQGSGFSDYLSVREMVTHFTSFQPRPRSVEEVIESVGLTEKADARAGTLSGGQQRRLDVALGIVGSPELLFLDEPTTGFDPEARRQFWQLIRDLRDAGTTIVLTTHYLEEAEALADRVAVLVRGTVIDVAPPSTLGGRADAKAIVRWTADGQPQEERTHQPTALVAHLAAAAGGEVAGLQVLRPTLEDVYLRMITTSIEGQETT